MEASFFKSVPFEVKKDELEEVEEEGKQSDGKEEEEQEQEQEEGEGVGDDDKDDYDEVEEEECIHVQFLIETSPVQHKKRESHSEYCLHSL